MLRALKAWLRSIPAIDRLAAAHYQARQRRYSRGLQHLVHTAGKEIQKAFFVKVGANDGITGDPFGDSLLVTPAWRGLLVEPVPYCVEKLARIYDNADRFCIEPIAIGRTPGTTTFYYVSAAAKKSHPDLPDWYDQVGSFNRQHILNELGARIEPFIVPAEIQVDSLANVLKKRGISAVTLLHIDTEGHDLEVLRSLDLSQLRPDCILVEHKHLSAHDHEAMTSLLFSSGYGIRDLGEDYFALLGDAHPCVRRAGRIGRIINVSHPTPQT